ncbi:HupE/UreJ family protein [Myxosarcina sp. GI1]|uniref:HupE/UreJ family protein n=1 Tax=Myxosarcina sp. GI1 TaxID=1541065 RepID=UPI0005673886|nr:HupE/UreJ family protein [Myxosarcina sp. GI1]
MSALSFVARSLKKISAIALAIFSWLLFIFIAIEPAQAHHAMGGILPDNFAEGFLSGLAHPVIGLEHLAFVAAIGLLAALSNKLGVIPLVFITATAIGTGIHLLSIDLFLPEVIITGSVSIVGIFLAQKNLVDSGLLIVFTVIAGIFHGYAYGESIVGAETTALSGYLLGFCLIQLVISATVFTIGRLVISRNSLSDNTSNLNLRFAGFTICGIGVAFLANTLIS